MAKLVIFEESEQETILETFELSASRLLIGSDPDNNLVLEAPDVDPSHASLELRNNNWVLQDLGAAGGTGVNGHLIQGPYSLRHNDLIELGPIRMSFQEEGVQNSAQKEETPEPAPVQEAEPLRGRIWFSFTAAATFGVIAVILILLFVADYLEVINLADLFPFLMLIG